MDVDGWDLNPGVDASKMCSVLWRCGGGGGKSVAWEALGFLRRFIRRTTTTTTITATTAIIPIITMLLKPESVTGYPTIYQ